MDEGESIGASEMLQQKNKRFSLSRLVLYCFMGIAIIAIGIGLFSVKRQSNEDAPQENVFCYKRSYHGHDYLFLSKAFSTVSGVVHDPDCACHKSAEKRQPSAIRSHTDGKRYLFMPTGTEMIPTE